MRNNNSLQDRLLRLRKNAPLIYNVTNQVTMDFIANGLIAIGASPVMSCAEEEVDELVSLSSSVVINMGTLDVTQISLFKKVARFCKKIGKKLVLDPVGAGSTALRTNTALSLLDIGAIRIIKGNASEITSIAGNKNFSKGVDSVNCSEEAIDSAKKIAKEYNICVVVSGEKDLVVTSDCLEINYYGDRLMSQVTGMGCLLTSVIAAFDTIGDNAFASSADAVSLFGKVGEMAKNKIFTEGPASFKTSFIDILYNLRFYSA